MSSSRGKNKRIYLILIILIINICFFTACKKQDQNLYWEDGSIQYTGDLEDGIPHGFGVWYYPNGMKAYEGEWENGKMSSEGTVFCCEDGSIIYEGNFDQGKCDGWGIRYENGEVVYEGEWENNLMCD